MFGTVTWSLPCSPKQSKKGWGWFYRGWSFSPPYLLSQIVTAKNFLPYLINFTIISPFHLILCHCQCIRFCVYIFLCRFVDLLFLHNFIHFAFTLFVHFLITSTYCFSLAYLSHRFTSSCIIWQTFNRTLVVFYFLYQIIIHLTFHCFTSLVFICWVICWFPRWVWDCRVQY